MKPFKAISSYKILLRVAEVVPLKQGLKPTKKEMQTDINHKSCRGSSIKTRIETKSKKIKKQGGAQVAEVVPLKQGLKQSEEIQLRNGPVSCRGSSIKTRIETCFRGQPRPPARVLQR